MNALSLLALQIEWGADEALAPAPVSRMQAAQADATDRTGATSAPVSGRTIGSEPIVSARIATGTSAAASRPPVSARGHAGPREAAGTTAAPAPPVADSGTASRPHASPTPPTGAVSGVPHARGGPVMDAQAAAAAGADLDALRDHVAAFTGCALRDTATRSVLPTGNPATAIVIVGEVPDEDEDRAGHPFAGRAGVLLDRMLDSIGLDRNRVLLLPLIPWRPPGGRAPNPIELNICAPFLQRALVLARPRFVLTMGSRPARVVADTAIRANAGWKRATIGGLPDGARVLAMRHPSYLLSHLPARREAWADLLRLRRALVEAEEASSITAA